MSESDKMQRLEAFRSRNHSLRLSASRVSAMAGFHPFAVLPELLMTLVYQGGQELLQHDARLLGIQIRSEEAILMELASKASKSTANALQSALDVKKGKRVLDTVHVADQVKQKVLKEAKSSKKLNPKEMKLLQEGVRSSVDTGYGTYHEDAALDLYERQCGWEVRDRNASIMAWPFAKAEDVADVQSDQMTVVPMSEAKTARTFTENAVRDSKKSKASSAATVTAKANGEPSDDELMKESSEEQRDSDTAMTDMVGASEAKAHDSDGENTPPSTQVLSSDQEESEPDECIGDVKVLENKLVADAGATENTDSATLSLPPLPVRPFFTIYGAVDGIRDELWCPPSDNNTETSAFDEEWQLRQIIVECKHRMRKTFHSPPLYDQIQTTAYCLMYNVDDADIVQVMRKPKPRTTRKVQKTCATNSAADRKAEKLAKSDSKDDIAAPETDGQNSAPAEIENETAISTYVRNTDSCSNETGDRRSTTELKDDKNGEAAQAPSETSEPVASNTEVATTSGDNAKQKTEDEKKEPSTTVEIDVKRVSLDDPLLQHRRNWNDIVLPRLRSFVEAVYRVRGDDSKRYRLLAVMSDPTGNLLEAWNIVHEECPWLKDCDTAFRRDY